MVRFLTAGESHGPEIVVIVDGLPAGIAVSQEAIDRDLARRQSGYGRGARARKIERDHGEVLSGLSHGRTTGAPVAVRVVNEDFRNQPPDPAPLTTPRPGHADLAGGIKYALADFRLVRERASARETAARVVAGALSKEALAPFGVRVASFVEAIGGVVAGPFRPDDLTQDELHALADRAASDPVQCPDGPASARMRAAIDEAREAGETLGGWWWVFATGVPPGLGSYVQWDRRLDGRLAQAVCSIQAVKGVEIGRAFEVASGLGSDGQDPILATAGRLTRSRNRAGGIEGGVTNGEPILVRAAMKPLSSIRAPIASVDLATGVAANPPYVRSDVCAVPAASVVAEAMVALVLVDAVTERFGSDRLDVLLAARQAIGDELALGPREAT
jgi:chorismate synthase